MAKIDLYDGKPIMIDGQLDPGSAGSAIRGAISVGDERINAANQMTSRVAGIAGHLQSKMMTDAENILEAMIAQKLEDGKANEEYLKASNNIKQRGDQVTQEAVQAAPNERNIQIAGRKHEKAQQKVIQDEIKQVVTPKAKALLKADMHQYLQGKKGAFSLESASATQQHQLSSLLDELDRMVDVSQQGEGGKATAVDFANVAIENAKKVGTIAPDKADLLLKRTLAKINNTELENSVKQDPSTFLTQMARGDMNHLSPDDKAKYRSMAGATLVDRKAKGTLSSLQLQQKETSAQMDLFATLKAGLQGGQFDRTDLLNQRDNLSLAQYQKLENLSVQQQVKQILTSKMDLAIDARLNAGASVADISPKELESHYTRKLNTMMAEQQARQVQDPNAPVLSPIQMAASIASRYPQSLPIFTKRLQAGLESSIPAEKEQSFKVYAELSNSSDAHVLKGLSSTVVKQFEVAKMYHETVGMSPGDALNKAASVLSNVDEDTLRTRRKNYSKDKPFNTDVFNAGEWLSQSVFREDSPQQGLVSKLTLGLLSNKDTPEVNPALANKVNALLKESYLETGDIEAAKVLAAKELQKNYGVTRINEKPTVMQLPPERYLPEGYDASQLAKYKASVVSNYQLPPDITPDKVNIAPDEYTKMQIASGAPPSYPMSYPVTQADGTTIMMPLFNSNNERVRFDLNPEKLAAHQAMLQQQAMQAQQEAAKAALGAAQQDAVNYRDSTSGYINTFGIK